MTRGKHEVIKFDRNGDLVLFERHADFYCAEAQYIDLVREHAIFGCTHKAEMNLLRREQVTTFSDGTIVKLINK